MQKLKKALSLVMVLAMMLGMIPAYAAETTPAAPRFVDTEGHWSQAAVERWTGYGIISGDERGNFDPDGDITRGALAKIIAETMGYKAEVENTYTDLPADAWYTPYVLKCAAAGVMGGYGDGRMGPNDPVTRQEASKMLCVTLGVAPMEGKTADFTDSDKIAAWAMPYVTAMKAAGYIQGVGEGTFAAEARLSRASAITILNNAVALYVNKAGTYTGEQKGIVIVVADKAVLRDVTVSGNLLVQSDNVTVEKAAVSGNLILAGDKAAVKNSTVKGDVTVAGDGANLEKVTVEGNMTVTGDEAGVKNSTVKGDLTVGEDVKSVTLTGTKVEGKTLGNTDVVTSKTTNQNRPSGGSGYDPEPEDFVEELRADLKTSEAESVDLNAPWAYAETIEKTVMDSIPALAAPTCTLDVGDAAKMTEFGLAGAVQFSSQAPTALTKPEEDTEEIKVLAAANTVLINTAIEKVSAQATEAGNGAMGRVVLPAREGQYIYTAAIHLQDNVELHLEDGAYVVFVKDYAQYLPMVRTRWEGTVVNNYSPMIYAYQKENVAVTGSGTFDAQAAKNGYWAEWRTKPDKAAIMQWGEDNVPFEERNLGEGKGARPSFVQTYECQNVRFEDFTVLNAPMWMVHPVFSRNMLIDGVTVRSSGYNNDGINMDSCKNVVVQNCDLNTGDDCVSAKSGKNGDGLRIATPCQNILIKNNTYTTGKGGSVTIGSEVSGDVRNIYSVGNHVLDTADLLQAVSVKTNSNRGGIIENLFVKDLTVDKCKDHGIYLTMQFEEGDVGTPEGLNDPIMRNLFIQDSTFKRFEQDGIGILGYDRSPIQNVRITNCTFESEKCPYPFNFSNGKDIYLNNLTFKLKGQEPFAYTGAGENGLYVPTLENLYISNPSIPKINYKVNDPKEKHNVATWYSSGALQRDITITWLESDAIDGPYAPVSATADTPLSERVINKGLETKLIDVDVDKYYKVKFQLKGFEGDYTSPAYYCPVALTGAAELPDITVPMGVDKDRLGLPEKVNFTGYDSYNEKAANKNNVTIASWACEDYDPAVPGTYTFYGAPSALDNTSNRAHIRAEQTVVVQEDAEEAVLALDFTSYAMPLGNGVCGLSPVVADGHTGTITWSVEDPTIAAVKEGTASQTGAVFETKAAGVTNAVATLEEAGGATHTAKCMLVVIDIYDKTTPRYVQLNTDRLQLSTGDTATLKNFIYPENVLVDDTLRSTLDTSVTYTSADPSVATVDANGVVTALGAVGSKTTITVETNVSERTNTCAVEIVAAAEPAPATAAAANEPVTLTVGQKGQLKHVFGAGAQVRWTSSNPFIACVDQTGQVTAQSRSSSLFAKDSPRQDIRSDPAKQTVEICATNVNGGAVETFTVKVEPLAVQPASVHVNKADLILPVGETRSITAAVAPASVLNNGGAYVSWSTSDANVVSIGANGANVFGADAVQLTGVAAGTATVTATTANGKIDTCTVTVTAGVLPITSIGLEAAKTIDIDQALQLKVDVTANAADKTLIWLCPDRTVATVDREGNVMGYSAGTVKIYAFAKDSLDADQLAVLAELGELRKIIGEDKTKLDDLLADDGVVYETCALTVADESIYLRNLHAPAEAVTSSSVNLLWNRASLYFAGDFDHYEVYVNGDKAADTEKLGHTVKGLAPATEYTFRVEAYVDGQSTPEHMESVTVTTKAAGRVLNVLDYGAAGDGSTLDTYAIQSAIAAAGAGDTVLLPEGHIFCSGALFLKSDMTFQVDGLLWGSSDSKDYPLMVTRYECWRKIDQPADEWENSYNGSSNQYAHASLINAGVYDEGDPSYTGPYNLHDLVICGKGQINGNGFSLANHEGSGNKNNSTKLDSTVRGRIITIHNGDGVYIEGVTLAYGPAWTTHVIFSKNVTVDNIKVVSINGATEISNGDALDPDSTVYMNIFDCFLMPGDDSVAIKSGRGQEGVDVDRPSAYIRVTDCRSGLGSVPGVNQRPKGGYSIGSEEGGGVHDVLFQNLYMDGAGNSHGLWIKAYACRSGLVEDIAYRDATVMNTYPKNNKYSLYIQIAKGVQEDSSGNANLANRFSRVRRVAYENVTIDYQMKIEGQEAAQIADYENVTPASYVEDVVFRGLHMVPHFVSTEDWYDPKPGKTDIGKATISYAKNITFENSTYGPDSYKEGVAPHPISFTALSNVESIVVDNQTLKALDKRLTVETALTVHNSDGSLTHGTGTVNADVTEGAVSVASILDRTAVTWSDKANLSVLKDGSPVTQGDLENGMVIRLTNDVPGPAGYYDYTVVIAGQETPAAEEVSAEVLSEPHEETPEEVPAEGPEEQSEEVPEEVPAETDDPIVGQAPEM